MFVSCLRFHKFYFFLEFETILGIIEYVRCK